MGAAMPDGGELTLIGRSYCHLCDEMRSAVLRIAAQRGLRLEDVDVDDDPALEARWGDLVPVLLWQGQEVCHYRLDPRALHDALEAGTRYTARA